MFSDRIRQGLIVLLALSQFITPFVFENNFANTPGESPLYLLPAGYAISIWLVIWLLSASYATYQLRPDQKDRELHRRLAPFLVVNMVFFNAWLLAQNQATVTATSGEQNPVWLVVTQTILVAMLAANAGAYSVIHNRKADLTRLDLWLVQIPVAVYFGWLSAAASTGFATLFYEAGWVGTQVGVPLTLVLLAVAALITGTVTASFNTKHGAVAYGAVIIWALISIGIENLSQSTVVLIMAWVMAVAILLVTMYTVNNRMDKLQQQVPPVTAT